MFYTITAFVTSQAVAEHTVAVPSRIHAKVKNVKLHWADVLHAPVVMALLAGLYVAAFYIGNNLTMLPPSSVLLLAISLPAPLVITVFVLGKGLQKLDLASHTSTISIFTVIMYLLIVMRFPILEIDEVREILNHSGGLESFFSKSIFVVSALLFASLIAFLCRRQIMILTVAFLVMVAAALLTVVVALTETEVGQGFAGDNSIALKNSHFAIKPNVYFILADGYSSFAYMQDSAIDVSAFKRFLRARNFRLYEEFFSNYQSTAVAMPAILNMTHHYYIIGRKVHEVANSGRVIIGGNNNVVKILKKEGFQTQYTHESSYLLLNGCSVDFCYPEVALAGAKAVLRVIIPNFLRQKSEWLPGKNIQAHLNEFMEQNSGPRFNYTHIFRPGHSPYRERGICDEPRQKADYAERVQDINTELQGFIENIISRDKTAVIVLTGDHGPHIENNCARMADLETLKAYRDRVGAVLAIHWPESYEGKYEDQIKTSVNMFRYVLASLMEDDKEILSTRAADDVYVQGSKDYLRILRKGEILIPPEHFSRQEMRQKFKDQQERAALN